MNDDEDFEDGEDFKDGEEGQEGKEGEEGQDGDDGDGRFENVTKKVILKFNLKFYFLSNMGFY